MLLQAQRHTRVLALPLAFVGAVALTAKTADAAVYLSGSVSAASSNAGLMKYDSEGASASVAMDLGRFMRVGFTHRQQFQESQGFVGKAEKQCDDIDNLSADECASYHSRTHIISNSIDLTVILYDGDVFVPFIMAGGVIKTYSSLVQKEGESDAVSEPATVGPVPNIGGGLGLKLNKDFTLKLTYTASPGLVVLLDGSKRRVWDKDTSIGLSYQL